MRLLAVTALATLSACAPHAEARMAPILAVAPAPADTSDGWVRGPGRIHPERGALGVLDLPETALAGRLVAAA